MEHRDFTDKELALLEQIAKRLDECADMLETIEPTIFDAIRQPATGQLVTPVMNVAFGLAQTRSDVHIAMIPMAELLIHQKPVSDKAQ